MAAPRAILSWSSGKDAAFALHEARRRGLAEIAGLLTVVNEAHRRVAMHAVRDTLLERQAQAAGLPLIRVPIPDPCPNEVYAARMAAAMKRVKADGIHHVVFGDLFLEDVRRYREKQLAGAGMAAIFP
ncbi:MAG: ATP-binding protein, partial [Alphaproteobacteria bacterium HGW-Alphaproteobacteria-5]